MQVPTYFSNFLGRIRLDESQLEELRKSHQRLTMNLEADPGLKKLIVGTFLQGSYKRATIIKPANGKRSDVDVVVVTRIGADVTPRKALDHFVPFVRKHYKENFEPQSRSIGITDGNVDLDLVITSAPSEAQEGLIKSEIIRLDESIEDATNRRLMNGFNRDDIYTQLVDSFRGWKGEPLHIPDRDVNRWEPTHPIAQIEWTTQKNRNCNDHYINVVRAIKWWHRQQQGLPKYPKGYPLEHMIGQCCPDGIKTIADGVTLTLETVVTRYAGEIAAGFVPNLKDHGVEQNVLKRLEFEMFEKFYRSVQQASLLARKALQQEGIEESVALWKNLFGEEFSPEEPGSGNKGRFIPPQGSSDPRGGRFG